MPLSGFILLALLNVQMRAPAKPLPATGISFVREHVEVEAIDPGDGSTEWAIAVQGIYHFQRPGPAPEPRRSRIFYPFPFRDGARYPDEITVSRPASDGGRTPVPFKRAARGISIPLFFPAGQTATVLTIGYRQPTGHPGGTYITSTTHAWEQPLERAEFVVRVPAALRLTAISYPPDRQETINGATVYRTTIDDFMPDQDLTIEWERSR